MFKAIVEFMILSNNQELAPVQNQLCNKIREYHKKRGIPPEELIFQLVMQTRKNPQPYWARNVWKLFGGLLDRVGFHLKEVRFCPSSKPWK